MKYCHMRRGLLLNSHCRLAQMTQVPVITISYLLDNYSPGHGDVVWNAGLCIAARLASPRLRDDLFKSCLPSYPRGFHWPPARVVELGAGAAIPSFTCLALGASLVVITDQPGSATTFTALHRSAAANSARIGRNLEDCVRVVPHMWGESCDVILGASDGAAPSPFDLVTRV